MEKVLLAALSQASAEILLRSNPEHCGWLRKINNASKAQRRYCVVIGGNFFYYQNEQSKKPKGIFNLHGYRAYKVADTGYSTTFVLKYYKPGRRPYVFIAPSEREQEEWVKRTNDVIHQRFSDTISKIRIDELIDPIAEQPITFSFTEDDKYVRIRSIRKMTANFTGPIQKPKGHNPPPLPHRNSSKTIGHSSEKIVKDKIHENDHPHTRYVSAPSRKVDIIPDNSAGCPSRKVDIIPDNSDHIYDTIGTNQNPPELPQRTVSPIRKPSEQISTELEKHLYITVTRELQNPQLENISQNNRSQSSDDISCHYYDYDDDEDTQNDDAEEDDEDYYTWINLRQEDGKEEWEQNEEECIYLDMSKGDIQSKLTDNDNRIYEVMHSLESSKTAAQFQSINNNNNDDDSTIYEDMSAAKTLQMPEEPTDAKITSQRSPSNYEDVGYNLPATKGRSFTLQPTPSTLQMSEEPSKATVSSQRKPSLYEDVGYDLPTTKDRSFTLPPTLAKKLRPEKRSSTLPYTKHEPKPIPPSRSISLAKPIDYTTLPAEALLPKTVYCCGMEKHEGTRILREEGILGCYLVRTHEEDGRYSLSVLVNEQTGETKHYKVFQRSNIIYLAPKDPTFSSLLSLIRFYHENTLPNCHVKLTGPYGGG